MMAMDWFSDDGAPATWRTPSAASAIEPEELTARIEALTAMANQTVAKVDRLTAASGVASSAASGSVSGHASGHASGITEDVSKVNTRTIVKESVTRIYHAGN